jgi:hypothetical protein
VCQSTPEAGQRCDTSSLAQRIRNTGVHVTLEQLDGYAIQGLLGSGHLDQDVVAGVVLGDETLNTAQLPFDSL